MSATRSRAYSGISRCNERTYTLRQQQPPTPLLPSRPRPHNGGRKAFVKAGSSKSLYAILDIDHTASREEIKRAFRRKARELHPDVNNEPDADDRFMEVLRAYDTLMDVKARGSYDARPSSEGGPRVVDPRFARFERWRGMVIPDLMAELLVWTREASSIAARWADNIQALEDEVAMSVGGVCAVLDAIDDQLASLTAQTRQAAPYSNSMQPLSSRTGTSAVPAAGPVAGITPSTLDQQEVEQLLASWQRELHVAQVVAVDAVERLTSAVEGGMPRMQRLVEKRYEQLSFRYPAYPEIVWIHEWEDAAASWMQIMDSALLPWVGQPQHWVGRLTACAHRADIQRSALIQLLHPRT